jgi:hypothetical protein
MRIRTGVDMYPPIGRPYRTQIDWGTISPKITAMVSKAYQGYHVSHTDENSTANDSSNTSTKSSVQYNGE